MQPLADGGLERMQHFMRNLEVLNASCTLSFTHLSSAVTSLCCVRLFLSVDLGFRAPFFISHL